MKLSKPQFKALWAAFKKGGAVHAPGRSGGGAKWRMLERMTEQQLLDGNPPFKIRLKGLLVLRDACAERSAKDSCRAYQDDLQEVEAALKELGK